jgi:TPR repeat protein
VEHNPELGQMWMRKAADAGDGGCQFDVGKMYQTGQGLTIVHFIISLN